MTEKLVVIGAGMASGRMLEHLFDANPDAYDVTLFNAEPRGNYNRLMLSPVLSGDKTYDEIVTHDDDWYAANGVTCRFGERVLGIDRERKMVVGEKGEVAYDKLVFGTGSNPFIIPLPGHDLDGVIPYRDLEDTEAMMQLGDKPGAKAVVIGGGLLGLEAAAGQLEIDLLLEQHRRLAEQLSHPAGQRAAAHEAVETVVIGADVFHPVEDACPRFGQAVVEIFHPFAGGLGARLDIVGPGGDIGHGLRIVQAANDHIAVAPEAGDLIGGEEFAISHP